MNFTPVTRLANRGVLKVKKNSPQILFVAGIVGTVATTVMASRATLKAQPIVQEMAEERKAIDASARNGGYTQQEYNHVVVEQYTLTTMKMTRLYGPTIIVGVVSIAALTKSHRQLTSRNQALTVAFTGLYKTFDNYRNRVREKLGDEQDQQFLHGTVTEQVVVGKNKDGSDKTKEITSLDPKSTADYSLFFCEDTCHSWVKDPGYNQTMLDGQEEWCSLKLKQRGHLFLNEVLDLLGAPRTKAGSIVGWIYQDLGFNDSHVDFGHDKDPEFVNGYSRDVMLNFNVAGPIVDLI